MRTHWLTCIGLWSGLVGSPMVAMGAAICKAGSCYSIFCTLACCVGNSIDPGWIFRRPGVKNEENVLSSQRLGTDLITHS